MALKIKYCLLILLLAFFVFRGLIPAWTSLNSDFPTYYVSSKMILNGENMDQLYDAKWFKTKMHDSGIDFDGRFSPFPPSNAFIMLPVAFFSPLTAKRIWIILNCFVLGLGIFLLKKITNWDYLDCSLIFLLSGSALMNNFIYGKVYLILCALIIYAHILQKQGKEILAGMLLGICVSLKYFPLIFVLSYLINRKFLLFKSAVATLIIMILIQYGYFGQKVFEDYVNIALLPHFFGQIEDVNPFAVAFQSWESFLRNMFVYSEEFNPKPLIKWEIGKFILQIIIYISLFFALIYRLRKIFLLNQNHFEAAVLSLPAFLCFVFLPAGATYHFLFMIFPIAIYLRAFSSSIGTLKSLILIIIYACIGFIPFGFILGLGTNGVNLLLSYPRLWLISLFFILSLYFLKNQYIAAQKVDE